MDFPKPNPLQCPGLALLLRQHYSLHMLTRARHLHQHFAQTNERRDFLTIGHLWKVEPALLPVLQEAPVEVCTDSLLACCTHAVLTHTLNHIAYGHKHQHQSQAGYRQTPVPAGAPRQAWLPLRGQAAPAALMLLPPPFWVTVDSTQHAKLQRLEEFYKFLQGVNLTLRGQVRPSGNRISGLHPESTITDLA
jgi:hypothetical protein